MAISTVYYGAYSLRISTWFIQLTVIPLYVVQHGEQELIFGRAGTSLHSCASGTIFLYIIMCVCVPHYRICISISPSFCAIPISLRFHEGWKIRDHGALYSTGWPYIHRRYMPVTTLTIVRVVIVSVPYYWCALCPRFPQRVGNTGPWCTVFHWMTKHVTVGSLPLAQNASHFITS